MTDAAFCLAMLPATQPWNVVLMTQSTMSYIKREIDELRENLAKMLRWLDNIDPKAKQDLQLPVEQNGRRLAALISTSPRTYEIRTGSAQDFFVFF